MGPRIDPSALRLIGVLAHVGRVEPAPDAEAGGGSLVRDRAARRTGLRGAAGAHGRVTAARRRGERTRGLGYGVYAQRYAAGTVASEPGVPVGLSLAVAPSPVGPAGGQVRYDVSEAGTVRVVVYDVLGRQVAVLADGERSAGTHDVALDAGLLAPGVYVVRLTAGEASVVRRVTVAR